MFGVFFKNALPMFLMTGKNIGELDLSTFKIEKNVKITKIGISRLVCETYAFALFQLSVTV